MRKIIQIAATYASRDDDDETPPPDRLFALCDDGSVWIHHWSHGRGRELWERLADIPQD
jgi:hypothetical protein